MIKRILRRILGKFGYEITRKDSCGFNSFYLSKMCTPKTVFDVGVGCGTSELYSAYPNAKFILVEPLEEFRSALEKISRRINCVIYYKALGDTEEKREITIESDPQLSSFCDRPRIDIPSVKRIVEVTTLDAILKDNPDIVTPILLKVDVEGYELKVLKGAGQLLKLTDMVIVEASVAKRFKNSSTLEEIILFMKENGFAVFDFLTICRDSTNAGTNMVDVVFKKQLR